MWPDDRNRTYAASAALRLRRNLLEQSRGLDGTIGMIRSFVFAFSGLALAGCAGGSGTPAGAIGPNGFASAEITAPITEIANDPNDTRVGSITAGPDAQANYRIGIDPDSGPTVAASLAPGTPALTAPMSGQATMNGTYGMFHLENARQVDGTWQGEITESTGDITLTAKFGAGTLTGGGDGLQVDGKITNSRISGLVSHSGVNADLDGIIGSGSTVGVFFGGGAGRGIAGAFAASAQ